MGADASFFQAFLLDPPSGLDPIAVQLPGRQNRAQVAVPANISETVAGILQEIGQVVGTPHIFWGHSFGGLIAFEVIRTLRRQGKPLPRLVITGTIAPHLAGIWQTRDVLLQTINENNSPEYLMAVAQYIDDTDLLRSILPVMRKDIPLLLNYQWDEENPLEVPITAFAARQDEVVYPDEIAAWNLHSKEFNLIEVD